MMIGQCGWRPLATVQLGNWWSQFFFCCSAGDSDTCTLLLYLSCKENTELIHLFCSCRHNIFFQTVASLQSRDNCTGFLTIFAHSPEQSWCDRQHSIADSNYMGWVKSWYHRGQERKNHNPLTITERLTCSQILDEMLETMESGTQRKCILSGLCDKGFYWRMDLSVSIYNIDPLNKYRYFFLNGSPLYLVSIFKY